MIKNYSLENFSLSYIALLTYRQRIFFTRSKNYLIRLPKPIKDLYILIHVYSARLESLIKPWPGLHSKGKTSSSPHRKHGKQQSIDGRDSEGPSVWGKGDRQGHLKKGYEGDGHGYQACGRCCQRWLTVEMRCTQHGDIGEERFHT